MVQLSTVQRRLEFFIAALYGRTVAIAAQASVRRGLWDRFLQRLDAPRHLRNADALATLDGATIKLPVALDAPDGDAAAIARYQLMALEQAERLRRGSSALVPDADEHRLEHDLYTLRESAAVDAAVLRVAPGLRAALVRERAAALVARPRDDVLTPAERQVEELLRASLMTAPDADEAAASVESSPTDSLAWARDIAASIGIRKRYRGISAVGLWGTLRPSTVAFDPEKPVFGGSPSVRLPTPSMAIKGGHIAGDDAVDPDEDQGLSEHEHDEGHPLVDDRYGTTAAPDDHGERGSNTPSQGAASRARELPPGVAYPEWDHATGQYRPHAAMVREYAPAVSDTAWAATTLARYAPLVHRIRAEFERLRARRARMTQQKEGDELDLSMVVRAMVDRRTGHTPDERLYTQMRRARRGLAISLLVDVSGSTDAPVADGLQIIDVAKITLLLAGEALDALGDLYSMLTFSSHGANDVRVSTIKRSAERNGAEVHARIAALEPGGYTRLGAAIRHATAQLTREPAGHRLLLVISDGKPHDFDHYQAAFAVEDSRQAVFEARAQGVFPFCIAIDAEGPEYLPHLFGPAGHVVVRQPEHLPTALLAVVRQLLRPG